MELRKGLWSGPIQQRKHTLEKIFPFGSGEDAREVMLYGSVEYGLKNGKELTVQWAARAVLAEYEGGLRFERYQVYLVSDPALSAWETESEEGLWEKRREEARARSMSLRERLANVRRSLDRTPRRSQMQ